MSSAQSATVQSSFPYSIGSYANFSSLSEAVVRELDGLITTTQQPAGSVVYRQGDKAESIFFLFSGRIKITGITINARTALLKIAQPGEMLGFSEAISGRSHISTAQALGNCLLGVLRRRDLIGSMGRHLQLSNALAQHLAVCCLDASAQMLLLRVPSSRSQRLATTLLGLSKFASEHRSRHVPLIYTHADLGQLIGASRETITRLLRKFKKTGVIDMKNSTIKIIDYETLKKLAELY